MPRPSAKCSGALSSSLLSGGYALDEADTAAIGFIAPDIRTTGSCCQRILRRCLAQAAGAYGRRAMRPLVESFCRKRVIEFCVALFGALSLLSASRRI